MSVTWRPAPQQQHLCGHRRCILLHRVAAAAMISAFVSLAWLLIAPCIAAIAAGGIMLVIGFGGAYWPCPREDLEALIKATREPRDRKSVV